MNLEKHNEKSGKDQMEYWLTLSALKTPNEDWQIKHNSAVEIFSETDEQTSDKSSSMSQFPTSLWEHYERALSVFFDEKSKSNQDI